MNWAGDTAGNLELFFVGLSLNGVLVFVKTRQ